jgi:hypothetical protein
MYLILVRSIKLYLPNIGLGGTISTPYICNLRALFRSSASANTML